MLAATHDCSRFVEITCPFIRVRVFPRLERFRCRLDGLFSQLLIGLMNRSNHLILCSRVNGG